MEYHFNPPLDEDVLELREIGYEIVSEILLPAYLSSKGVPAERAENLFVYTGYIYKHADARGIMTLDIAKREEPFYRSFRVHRKGI